MIYNMVERAGIEPATLTRVRPAFPLSYLPIYPLIAGIARPAHTTLRKGISTSFPCIFRHIHGAYCAGADSSSQTFIPRCWHAALLMSYACPMAFGASALASPRAGEDQKQFAPLPSCRLRDV